MFTQTQISRVAKLVTDVSVDDILDEDEMTIMVNKSLLCDALIVSKSRKTMMLKKLVIPGVFDLLSILEDINATVKVPYELRIGMSFIAQTKEDKYIYFFAIRGRCLNHETRMIFNDAHFRRKV